MHRFLIHISLDAQRLELFTQSPIPDWTTQSLAAQPLAGFPVSTSRYGAGTEEGSLRTPTGRFAVCEKFGDGAPLGTVFASRMPTGEILAALENPGDPRDAITTRILWLTGLEAHNENTRDRYIYIHGTNHEEAVGAPASHGCVRMRNADVIRLFELVPVGTEVCIEP